MKPYHQGHSSDVNEETASDVTHKYNFRNTRSRALQSSNPQEGETATNKKKKTEPKSKITPPPIPTDGSYASLRKTRSGQLLGTKKLPPLVSGVSGAQNGSSKQKRNTPETSNDIPMEKEAQALGKPLTRLESKRMRKDEDCKKTCDEVRITGIRHLEQEESHISANRKTTGKPLVGLPSNDSEPSTSTVPQSKTKRKVTSMKQSANEVVGKGCSMVLRSRGNRRQVEESLRTQQIAHPSNALTQHKGMSSKGLKAHRKNISQKKSLSVELKRMPDTLSAMYAQSSNNSDSLRKGPTSAGTLSGTTTDGTVSGTSTEVTVSGITTNGTVSGTTADGAVSGTTTDGTVSGTPTDGTVSGITTDGTVSGTSTDVTMSELTTDGTVSGTSTDVTMSEIITDGTVSGTSTDVTMSEITTDGTVSGTSTDVTMSEITTDVTVSRTTTDDTVSGTTNDGTTTDGTVSGNTTDGTVCGTTTLIGITTDGTVSGNTTDGTVSRTTTSIGITTDVTMSGTSSTDGTVSRTTTVIGITTDGTVSGTTTGGAVSRTATDDTVSGTSQNTLQVNTGDIVSGTTYANVDEPTGGNLTEITTNDLRALSDNTTGTTENNVCEANGNSDNGTIYSGTNRTTMGAASASTTREGNDMSENGTERNNLHGTTRGSGTTGASLSATDGSSIACSSSTVTGVLVDLTGNINTIKPEPIFPDGVMSHLSSNARSEPVVRGTQTSSEGVLSDSSNGVNISGPNTGMTTTQNGSSQRTTTSGMTPNTWQYASARFPYITWAPVAKDPRKCQDSAPAPRNNVVNGDSSSSGITTYPEGTGQCIGQGVGADLLGRDGWVVGKDSPPRAPPVQELFPVHTWTLEERLMDMAMCELQM